MDTANTTASTRKHHPFSPSTLQCREVSLYWASVDGDSEASRAGTDQHAAVDMDELPENLSDVQAEAVVMCKNYWAKILLNYPGGTYINEEYLNIDDETIYDKDGDPWLGTTGGYLDRGAVSADKKRAAICDWKFGQWSVEPAETNLQGIAYLLGLFHRYPTLEEVEVHFLLPHRNESTSHTFKRAEFESLYLRVKTVVHRAMRATWGEHSISECVATTSSCIFCANVGICPGAGTLSLKIGKKFAPLLIPNDITPSLILDPAQARLGLECAQLVAVWAKAYRSQAAAKAIEDESFIPEGYKLREKREREIVDRAAVEKIAKESGISDKQLDEARSLTLTPLFKAARANALRGAKEQAEETLSDALLAAGALEYSKSIIFLERIKT